MKHMKNIHFQILSRAQQRIWEELGDTPTNFVLYGGTAISLRLGHRTSADFIFLSNQDFEPKYLYITVPYLKGSSILEMSSNRLTCSVERCGLVSVYFFGGLSLGRVEEPNLIQENNVCVASLLDLGASKVRDVIINPSWADYADVDALLQSGVPLIDMLSAAWSLFDVPYSPLFSLKVMAYFEGVGADLSQDMRNRIIEAIEDVDLDTLRLLTVYPQLAPERGMGGCGGNFGCKRDRRRCTASGVVPSPW